MAAPSSDEPSLVAGGGNEDLTSIQAGFELVDREKAILAIYTRLWMEAQALHGYVINLNSFIATGNIVFAGLLISLASNAHGFAKVLLAIVPLTLAGIGIFVTRVLWKDFLAVAGIIRQIDAVLGAFEPGRFLGEAPLYPRGWLEFGQTRWFDGLFTAFPIVQAFLGGIAATLVWLR
jgi:hypothetical protein